MTSFNVDGISAYKKTVDGCIARMQNGVKTQLQGAQYWPESCGEPDPGNIYAKWSKECLEETQAIIDALAALSTACSNMERVLTQIDAQAAAAFGA